MFLLYHNRMQSAKCFRQKIPGTAKTFWVEKHDKMHNKTKKDYEKASLLPKGKYVIIGLPNRKGVVLYGKGITGRYSGK